MKKDKAVRKAEIRAAILKQLKSMIAPLIILFIIIAGVFVIVSYTAEEVEEEIIEKYGYEEGSVKDLVLENDKFILTMDPDTTQFQIEVKDTGMIWYSNPLDADEDAVASKVDKDKLKSTLILTYSNTNGLDTLYNNYANSILNKTYEIEKGDNYITVHYSLGQFQREYVIPTVMKEQTYDDYFDAFDGTNRVILSQFYKKYDLDNLDKKDNKETLLANYPILEEGPIYVLREATKDNMRLKLEQVFEGIGYTYEQFAEDRELDMTISTSDKPEFNVDVTYRIDGDDLVVEVPLDKMEYKNDYPIIYVSVLPFFGAGGLEETGYMMVPEGGGAIINFNNGKIKQNSYYANVYGWDMATMRREVVQETRTNYNVFGIAKNDNSFICIVEDGAPYAGVQASISQTNNSYNSVNVLFNVMRREQYDIGDRYTGKMFVYEKALASESMVNRYCFVDSDDYVDMAKTYGDYLKDQYGDSLAINQDTQAPIAVEILGAVDKVTQVMGVPVNRPWKLTTYKEADEMIQELYSEGLQNMHVKLTGWANGGVRQHLMKDVNLVSSLGNKKTLQTLIDNANASNIPVYLDAITNYSYDSNFFEGFFIPRDVARLVSNEKAELYPYSKVTYNKLEDDQAVYYLLKPNVINKVIDTASKTAKKYNANISFNDIGRDLSSDYSRSGTTTRLMAMNNQIDKVKEIQESGTKVMVNMGNDFLLPYVDIVTNMDLTGYNYTILDGSIPFLQLAIHGYVNYTGEPINITQNMADELLKSAEYGAGLSFTLMKETAFALQKTLYSEYFGADYSSWHERLVETYNRYNAELGHIFNQEMINHSLITKTVACTTYEDGTKVYVNYGYEEYVTNDGVKIPAREYIVVQ